MGARLTLKATPVSGSADSTTLTSRVLVEASVTTYGGTFCTDGSVTGELTLDGEKIGDFAAAFVLPDTTTQLYRGEHTVQHKSNGSKTVQLSAWITITEITANITAEKTVELPVVYHGALLRFDSFTLGRQSPIAVTLRRGHVCALRYRLGSRNGRISDGSAESVVYWTPPENLAAEILQSTEGSGLIEVYTYEYGKLITFTTFPFTAVVPPHIVPAAQIEEVTLQSDSVPAEWNTAVAGHTRLHYRVAAQEAYGAAITACRFTCGTAEGEGSDGVSSLLLHSGSFIPRVQLRDSRGRTAEAEGEPITVEPYFLPVIDGIAAQRTLSDGTPNEKGSCVRIGAQLRWADVAGHNTAWLAVRRRAVDGQWSEWESAADGAVLSGFDINTNYELQLRATDALGGEKTVTLTVPACRVSLHLRPGGSGGAFGQFAEKDGVLQIAWDVEMLGAVTVGGRTLCDLLYPVGSIYMSVSAADPAALFGGTWQRVEDTFLLAAGSTYAAGERGGEAKVTLSVSEMPSHSHNLLFENGKLASGSSYSRVGGSMSGGLIGSSGGGQPHNNMPPYLAVYVWQRTA